MRPPFSRRSRDGISECTMPAPAVIHCTPPGRISPRWPADRFTRRVIDGTELVDQEERIHLDQSLRRDRTAHDESAAFSLLVCLDCAVDFSGDHGFVLGRGD